MQRSCVQESDDAPAKPTGVFQAAASEVRDQFPMWFTVWLPIGHVFTAMWLVQPARPSALATVLLPLSWAAVFLAVRRRRGKGPPAGVLALLCATAPLIALLWWLPAWLMYDVADPTRLKFGFEVLSLAWVVALIWHCFHTRGWRGVAVFFGVGAVYGLCLENGGITLGFFSEPDYRLYVPFTRTPLSSVAGWCTIFYPSAFIAESLLARWVAVRRSILASAALLAAIALSSDLHFDPIATALRMWVWHPTLPAAYLGVPLVNYTSWFTSVSAFAGTLFVAQRRGWTARSLPMFAVFAIPAMLLMAGAGNLLLIGALEGFSGPSWTLLLAAVRAALP